MKRKVETVQDVTVKLSKEDLEPIVNLSKTFECHSGYLFKDKD